ncbi:hypothetical protein EVAR_102270_1 [Eumeta japonica]|uniref:Uncharacterized protein n=1 Tax=Eumeta variegata TaxID=151549 RepID=A0A4C1WIG2_EUMVA|nr:hypothetical protein EVAR_102270_1 [Eumeta japonica]
MRRKHFNGGNPKIYSPNLCPASGERANDGDPPVILSSTPVFVSCECGSLHSADYSSCSTRDNTLIRYFDGHLCLLPALAELAEFFCMPYPYFPCRPSSRTAVPGGAFTLVSLIALLGFHFIHFPALFRRKSVLSRRTLAPALRH